VEVTRVATGSRSRAAQLADQGEAVGGLQLDRLAAGGRIMCAVISVDISGPLKARVHLEV